MKGEIVYSYVPDAWDQDKFLSLGGFTIVFLNYNKSNFIGRSVASALEQDFSLCEIFFMDDASTDGSGDEMEHLARQYRGRHKVTVVRNSENQHIVGQWNIVSKVATGNWLGMFCADDVAYPNRVTVAAGVVRQHPSLKGFCTGAMAVDVRTGERHSEPRGPQGNVVYCGGEGLWGVALQKDMIFGATAWWHRSLFEPALCPSPLDDVHLRWVLQAKSNDSKEPVWLCSDQATIEYSVGSGITSEMRSDRRLRRSAYEQWLLDTRALRKFYCLMIQSLTGVKKFMKSNHYSGVVLTGVRVGLFKFRALNGNTLTRVCQLPELIWLCAFFSIPLSVKKAILREYVKFFIKELFGLRAGCFLSLALHDFQFGRR